METLQNLSLTDLQRILKKIYTSSLEERIELYKLYNISGKFKDQIELTVATMNIKNEK